MADHGHVYAALPCCWCATPVVRQYQQCSIDGAVHAMLLCVHPCCHDVCRVFTPLVHCSLLSVSSSASECITKSMTETYRVSAMLAKVLQRGYVAAALPLANTAAAPTCSAARHPCLLFAEQCSCTAHVAYTHSDFLPCKTLPGTHVLSCTQCQ
jgi:hypothetical protein